MGKTVVVGAACVEAVHDPDKNVRQLEQVIQEAASQNVQILVLPECVIQGYPDDLAPGNAKEFGYYLRHAETVPGPSTERLATVAQEHNMEVVVGLTEKSSSREVCGKLHDSAAVLRGGEVSGRYRKMHTGAWEKLLWNRGREFLLTETALGMSGVMICYDMTFPEVARELALAGAEALLVPTAWPMNNEGASTIVRGYELFTRARALENQVLLVCSNLVGGRGEGFYGHSRVVGPAGDILDESADAGIAVAEVEVPDTLLDARAGSYYGMVFLRDREEPVYGSLIGRNSCTEPAARKESPTARLEPPD